ncbi:MAG: prolipoprotein diacylglyceryl transferase [Candidatus Obscuribacterales bacterium]|nr:prolipoprotein diacylglyceryl transferase [Candidatus Obscuribacterales bacterium]
MYIGKLDPVVHFAFESLAYFVGFRLYLFLRKRDSLDLAQRTRIIASVVGGAAIGSKLITILADPATMTGHFASMESFAAGKGVVGALVGGWLSIELCKFFTGIKSSTGDTFVLPLIVAMVIGRIGCFVTGFHDRTYGLPADLPWAYDFGDGIKRHPSQIYEILALLCILVCIELLRPRLRNQGDQFKFFMSAYMVYRLGADTFKPVPHPYFNLSIEQVVAVCVLLYYSRFLLSLFSSSAPNNPSESS